MNILEDKTIPLHERYYYFLEKYTNTPNKATMFIANKLHVNPTVVDTFLYLGIMNEEELKNLEKLEINVDILGIIVRQNPENRNKIYGKLNEFLGSDHPCKEIVEYIQSRCEVMSIEELVDLTEPHFWKNVAKYIIDLEICNGPIFVNWKTSKRGKRYASGLPSMLRHLARGTRSEKMFDWLERAIIWVNRREIGVFNSEFLRETHPSCVKNILRYIKENQAFHKHIIQEMNANTSKYEQ